MSELQHPTRSIITDAAYDYIRDHNWTLVAVGHNKRPLGEWGPGGNNRYDYTNVERVYQLDAPGIGVITGPSGLVIIDLDNETAIRAWAERFGVPMTRVAKTPRGRHLYYKAPLGIHIPPGTEILPGVDVRGGESYAILPPSHLDNGNYEWVNNAPIQALPDEVCDLVLEQKPKRKQKILSGEPFAEGTRNDHLFSMACSMRRGGFDYTSILAALAETNKTRCSPPVTLTELESITESAISYEEGQPSGLEFITHLRALQATRDADDKPVLDTYTRRLDTRHLVDADPPQIDWIWDGFLAPGTLSMIHGEGGLGKSWLALKIAEQMLQPRGGELFTQSIHPGGVIILDGENAENQIHTRIHYTTISADADLAYYMVDEPILGLEEITEQYLDHLVTTHNPRLVIIDSQRALWAGDEKEQAEAGRMLRSLARFVERHPCAYLVIHHDNRGGDYAGSSDINAAISGCRLHIKRHADKDQPHARILTQPKNRIAPEMPRQEFVLDINVKPRSHRADLSGIKLAPYTSDAAARRAEWLETAVTLAANSRNGVAYKDLWIALGWDIKTDKDGKSKGVETAHSSDWEDLKKELEDRGFTCDKVDNIGRVYRST